MRKARGQSIPPRVLEKLKGFLLLNPNYRQIRMWLRAERLSFFGKSAAEIRNLKLRICRALTKGRLSGTMLNEEDISGYDRDETAKDHVDFVLSFAIMTVQKE